MSFSATDGTMDTRRSLGCVSFNTAILTGIRNPQPGSAWTFPRRFQVSTTGDILRGRLYLSACNFTQDGPLCQLRNLNGRIIRPAWLNRKLKKNRRPAAIVAAFAIEDLLTWFESVRRRPTVARTIIAHERKYHPSSAPLSDRLTNPSALCIISILIELLM
jgi:hypothetical protein